MKKLTVLLFIIAAFQSTSQDRFQQIRNELTLMSVEYPGLDEPVTLRVTGSSLQAFITAIANTHNLNVNVSNDVEGEVVNNFTNATVLDVFVFLAKEYNLEIEKIGESILSFKPYKTLIIPEVYSPKVPKVSYTDSTDFLSLDLRNDSLQAVAMEITKQTLSNVILDPLVKNEVISVFIQNRPMENALEMMAFANGMKLRKDNNFYVLEKIVSPPGNDKNQRNKGRSNTNYRSNANTSKEMALQEVDGRISVSAEDVPIIDLISEVSKVLHKNFYVNSDIEGTITIFVENADYEEFLGYVLSGTEYSYKNFNNVYLLGNIGSKGMMVSKVMPIKNRVVEKITELLPTYLQEGVEILEYIGTNSLIVSGPAQKVHDIEMLVEQLDVVVPNVLINVVIMSVEKTDIFSTGVHLEIGQDRNTNPTFGTILSDQGTSLNLSTESINNLVNGINGLGVINIGAVSPNVFMAISAMEENGVLKVKSTPSISAQNGVEASLSIGETDYYFEASNNLVPVNTGTGGQNLFTNSGTYKQMQANLTITIRPIATNEEYVTLKITVDQQAFGERVGESGPRGTVTRNFESIIRVKNGEMLLLGGLDQKETDNSGSGVPGVSKVPILKRLFGRQTSSKGSNKLTLLIQPTISY